MQGIETVIGHLKDNLLKMNFEKFKPFSVQRVEILRVWLETKKHKLYRLFFNKKLLKKFTIEIKMFQILIVKEL